MKSCRAFTLLELMITLAVAAILVTVAVPGLRQFIQNSRVTAQANELVTAINVARSEAAKRGVEVELCASENQADCTNSNGWADGWIVREAGGGAPLRVWGEVPDLQINVVTGGQDIVFGPMGEADGALELTLRADGCTGDNQRRIDVTISGRPSVVREACP